MHGERGQVLPLMAIGLLAVLLGLAGLAIDVGSWYQAKRHVQAVADASALAAAQALPGDGVTAKSYATSYAATNGGSIDTPQFAPATSPTKDTVTVTATQSAPSFFLKALGIGDITVRATATATAYAVSSEGNVLPLAVSKDEPALNCGGRPCFDQPTSLLFQKINGLGGGFGLLDLSNGNGANPSTLADWITNGYPGEVALGTYQSPGNKFSANAVRSALTSLAARHPIVLLPIYSTFDGSGGNGNFDVVGFGAFHVDSWNDGASTMRGEFVHMIAHGPHDHGTALNYFGISGLKLTG